MVLYREKKNCCGCGACVQICNHDALSMHEDEEGFFYPYISSEKCTECGMCRLVCPMSHGEEAGSTGKTETVYVNKTEEKTGENTTISRQRLMSGIEKIYGVERRLRDIVLSGLGLAFLWPLMVVTAVVICMDDPHGSPVFRQRRIGRDGKAFTMYKFRSMYMDAESRLEDLMKKNEMDGPVFKIKDDPRITRVGRFIRKYSIDELPQLINVLKGDMSIVGPRPALPREVEQYNDYQRQRLCVTPGLTCYWQILPYRNEISFEEWVDLDIQYIKERDMYTDWKIIFKTVGAVIRGDGE